VGGGPLRRLNTPLAVVNGGGAGVVADSISVAYVVGNISFLSIRNGSDSL